MDFDGYRREGKRMVDYIADYLENIRCRRVFPDVSPGYMRHMVPDTAPENGEQWSEIFQDVERVIMPGVTHWQSPYMHAYFPALNSFPSLLGDMLADAIGCLGFTWASSPACTELEIIVTDWLAKMIGLPSEFFHSNKETMGGGVIQTTASEATLISLLAARTEAIKRFRTVEPDLDDVAINARLVGYCSDQAHSSVEKAGLIGLVKMRLLMSDEQLSLRGKTLREAIEQDKQLGLIPFYLCATLGTTGACAFDNLTELGPICKGEGMWMHVDAAYAGTSFICPEFRVFMNGVEYADSFAFNPSKWMMVHFDCTAMWVKDSRALHRTFNVQPLYLCHENTGTAIDYMHWQIPLSKRFRALKLWFVIRSFGVTGLQNHVRNGVRLAKKFEQLVVEDSRFEVAAKRYLGMVVFRLRGDNGLTEMLLRRLNSSGDVHMVPASLQGRYVIRFTVTSVHTHDDDIERDWAVIRAAARDLFASISPEPTATELDRDLDTSVSSTVADPDTEKDDEVEVISLEKRNPRSDKTNAIVAAIQSKRNRLRQRGDFGLSLLLSNVPTSPMFINGSFAALFDSVDLVNDYARHISNSDADLNGSPIRLSPRRWAYMGIAAKSRQLSLDQSFPVLERKQQKVPIVGVGKSRATTGGFVSNAGGDGKFDAGDKQKSNGVHLSVIRQGSLDSQIEEMFQRPIGQVDLGKQATADPTDDHGEKVFSAATSSDVDASSGVDASSDVDASSGGASSDFDGKASGSVHGESTRFVGVELGQNGDVKNKTAKANEFPMMTCAWCGHVVGVSVDSSL